MLSHALPDEERKAWCKAVKPTLASDFLAKKMCEGLIAGNDF